MASGGRWTAAVIFAALCAPLGARAEGPTVTRFVACADLADRQCVGEGQRFGPDVGTVWAYAVVDNRGDPLPLSMIWRRDGRPVFTAELEVGRSRRWRTWSRKRVRGGDAGGWTVELRRADLPDEPPLAVVAFAVGDGPVPVAEAPAVPAAPDPEDAPPPPAPIAPPAPVAPPPAPVAPPAAPDPIPTPEPSEPAPAAPIAPDPPPEAAPMPPAAAPQPDPAPTQVDPAPPPTPAAPQPPAASTAPPADTVCRAWANIRRDGADGPIYETLDVRIGPRVRAERAPGLVVAGADELFALAMVPRTVSEAGPGGEIQRSWTMLYGRGLKSGSRRVWAGFPATMGPPERGEGPRFEQRNGLVVRSIVGPYVGLEAALYRDGPGGQRNRMRAMTVGAPDVDRIGLDPGPALRAAFADLPPAKRPDPAAVDPDRFALIIEGGRVVARAFAPCCGRSKGEPVQVEVPIAPDATTPGLTADGRFTDVDGCVIEGKAGSVMAGLRSATTAVGPQGAVLLGVAWVPVNHRHRAAAQHSAVQTLR